MGRLRRVTQFSAIAFAFAAACSLGVNEDDYVGGTKTDAGGGIDGGGPSDSPTTDDGGSSCTFPGKTFCATVEGGAFCNDFDETRLFSDRIVASQGTVAIDCQRSLSSPNSLRSTTESAEAGAKGQLSAIVNGFNDKYARLSFDVMVGKLARGENAIGEIRFDFGNNDLRIVRGLIGEDDSQRLTFRVDHLYLGDAGTLERRLGTRTPVEVASGWKHVDIEFVQGGFYHARICVDGVDRSSLEWNKIATTPKATIFVGLENVTAIEGGQDVSIDNVVVSSVKDTPPDGGGPCCTCGD